MCLFEVIYNFCLNVVVWNLNWQYAWLSFLYVTDLSWETQVYQLKLIKLVLCVKSQMDIPLPTLLIIIPWYISDQDNLPSCTFSYCNCVTFHQYWFIRWGGVALKRQLNKHLERGTDRVFPIYCPQPPTKKKQKKRKHQQQQLNNICIVCEGKKEHANRSFNIFIIFSANYWQNF